MNGNTVGVTPASWRSTRSASISMNDHKMINAPIMIPIIVNPKPIAMAILLLSVWRNRRNGKPVLRNKIIGMTRKRITFAAVFHM